MVPCRSSSLVVSCGEQTVKLVPQKLQLIEAGDYSVANRALAIATPGRSLATLPGVLMNFRFPYFLPSLARACISVLATVPYSYSIDLLRALPPYTNELTLRTRHNDA